MRWTLGPSISGRHGWCDAYRRGSSKLQLTSARPDWLGTLVGFALQDLGKAA